MKHTSISSYGTVTDQAYTYRHRRNCSSRTFYTDLYSLWVYIEDLTISSGKNISEDLLRQAPTQRIFKISMQGPHKDLLRRISTGSPQDLLTQGPARDNVRTPRRFHEDFFKSFSQGPAQDHAKALTAFYQDLHKIFSQGAVKDQDLHASCQVP